LASAECGFDFFSPFLPRSDKIISIKFRRSILPLFVVLLAASLSGCSPTWEVGGAYFPAWLICMVAGLACTLATRFALIRLGLDPWIRPRALGYPAIGIFFTLVVYLIFFTR
jgi:hypothetical protein